jgi:phosphotransferase system enzyme I (PtsI)
LFNGIGVSRGYAIGEVHILNRDQLEVLEHAIPEHFVESEVERFHQAVENARAQLRAVRENIPPKTPADICAFIDTHLLMLDDPMLHDAPIRIIRERQCNAEWALKLQRDALVGVFDAMDDAYLRTRRDDVEHVIQRIQRTLLNSGREPLEDVNYNWRGQIVVADDLTPADTVSMQHQGVAGFVTESGGQLSHTAILARSLGIPAVVGVHEARRYIKHGEKIVIDGHSGMVLADPDERAIRQFRARQREYRRQRSELALLKDAPAKTRDGINIVLLANIEIKEDLRALRRVNASGVGLYRTEFLYLNRPDIPTEQEHYRAYLKVLRALKGAPLTIRTVDLGADKDSSTEQLGPLAHNPALGLRGIRRCLAEPALFVPQLRAILRASARGPISVLFPMVTNVAEVQQTLELLEQTKHSLRRKGYKFDEQIPVGAMIEVPAAAVSADRIAEQVDFLSIGTNDLIQYTLAIDRIDDEVNYLYDPLHCAVLTLIHHVIQAGKRVGVPVSMCGEMAGDPRYVRLLLGMGLRYFSAPPNSLLEVKNVVNNSRMRELKSQIKAIMQCADPNRQADMLAHLNEGAPGVALHG